ncbi:unnamed protein product [Brachionus calyciflorus]|uniref:G-protein coupled receptors family 1 profile domain-containing protein n=1 Tax=Brachionus calyciflorus TaxID=104777 RepID=A0A814D5Z3_9BILA|nr:unnamed protein product [Brachionus calyciflorus]
MSSWLNLFLTIDRLMSIKFSRSSYKFFKSKKYILSLIIICLFTISVLNIPSLWFRLNYTLNNSTNLTTVTCVASTPLVLFLRDLAAISLRTAIPFFLIFTTNTLLIRFVIVSRQEFKNNLNSWRKKQNFAFSIIAMNIFFLFNLIPVAITTILFNIYQTNPQILAGVNLATFISIYISILNQSCPFLINLKFNKLFFKEFVNMIKELKGFVTRNKVVHSTDGTYANSSSLQQYKGRLS